MVASVISDELIGGIMVWVSEFLEQNVFLRMKNVFQERRNDGKFSVLIIHDVKFLTETQKHIELAENYCEMIVPLLTIPSYRLARIIKKHFISPHNFRFNAKSNFYEVVNYSILTMKKFSERQWPHRKTEIVNYLLGNINLEIFSSSFFAKLPNLIFHLLF